MRYSLGPRDQQATCVTLRIKVKNPLNRHMPGPGLMASYSKHNSEHNEQRGADEWDYRHQENSVLFNQEPYRKSPAMPDFIPRGNSY